MWESIKRSVREHPIRWFFGAVAVGAAIYGLWSLDSEESNFEKASKILLGIGGLVGIAIATWRNHELQRQADAALAQVETANEQVRIADQQAQTATEQAKTARKTQVSEQLTQAMDLLARTDSNGMPLKEARIGGLYSLESLAHADPEGYGVQAMKTIVAYIRENAQKTALVFPGTPEKRKEPSPLGEDVKTAFHVFQILCYAYSQQLREQGKLQNLFDEDNNGWEDLDFSGVDFRWLDLSNIIWIEHPHMEGADLRGAKLEGRAILAPNLRRTDLRHANLEGTWLDKGNLEEADLRGANLREVSLQSANLREARLQEANLWRAELQGADLENAQLQGANLGMAKLQGTNLSGAGLEGADLQGAELQGANLHMADLCGANLQRAKLQGANLKHAHPPLSMWHKVKFETNRESLKQSLQDARLPEDEVNEILQRFDKKGNEGLWRPTKLQVIFCDEDFAPLQYSHAETKRIKPDDSDIEQWENTTWQEGWKVIIGDTEDTVDPLCRPYAIRGFIDIHGCMRELRETRCARGLRKAIRDLDDYATIYEQLPGLYKKWLNRDNPPKPSSA